MRLRPSSTGLVGCSCASLGPSPWCGSWSRLATLPVPRPWLLGWPRLWQTTWRCEASAGHARRLIASAGLPSGPAILSAAIPSDSWCHDGVWAARSSAGAYVRPVTPGDRGLDGLSGAPVQPQAPVVGESGVLPGDPGTQGQRPGRGPAARPVSWQGTRRCQASNSGLPNSLNSC